MIKLRPRIIPCLLLADGALVKTIKFRKPNYLGDPINAVKIFNEKEDYITYTYSLGGYERHSLCRDY